MNATDKVALQKLSVLELAQSLGNVTEACRQRGVSRTQFYEYKRRFQTHGIEGLKDLPPIHKTHPFTTPPETVKRILALSLEHPGWGCIKLSSMLKLEEINVSSPTIQNILIKNNMGSIYERMLKLEEKAAQKAIELTPEQVAQIEKYNPCFCERHVESSRPGKVLSQDTFYVGTLKGRRGLFACCCGHLQQLCLWLSAYQQTARSCRAPWRWSWSATWRSREARSKRRSWWCTSAWARNWMPTGCAPRPPLPRASWRISASPSAWASASRWSTLWTAPASAPGTRTSPSIRTASITPITASCSSVPPAPSCSPWEWMRPR